MNYNLFVLITIKPTWLEVELPAIKLFSPAYSSLSFSRKNFWIAAMLTFFVPQSVLNLQGVPLKRQKHIYSIFLKVLFCNQSLRKLFLTNYISCINLLVIKPMICNRISL